MSDVLNASEAAASPAWPVMSLAQAHAAGARVAYLLVEEGKNAEAIAALQTLMQDQEAPQGLRARARQIIVALGGEVAQG